MVEDILADKEWQILQAVIEKYLKTAQPVSSLLLHREGDIELSPSMIRYYFWQLTRQGFLIQPHTSAGRLPTHKALELFISRFLKEFNERENFVETVLSQINKWLEEKNNEPEELLKNLAIKTKGLCFLYLLEDDFVYKYGFKYLLDYIFQFEEEKEKLGEALDDLDARIKNLNLTNASGVSVYIGFNNPLIPHPDFSTIISSDENWGLVGLLGPNTILKQRNFCWLKAAHQVVQELTNS